MYATKAEGRKSKLAGTTMMVLAVTLHNIPEGMAVGIVYAGFLNGNFGISAGAALALSSVSPFKTSRKAPSSPCLFMLKDKVK